MKSYRPRPDLVPTALVWGVVFAVSASVAQPAGALTEAEFLSTLDQSHPATVALMQQLAEARAGRRQAGAVENPTLEFEREAPDGTAEQVTLRVGWRPPLDGRRGAAINAAEAELAAAKHSLELDQLQLRQEFRGVFADWALQDRRTELVAAHHLQLQDLESRLNARAERGEESLLAVRRFGWAVARVRAQLGLLEAELAQRRADALVLREDLPREAKPDLPVPPPAPMDREAGLHPVLAARTLELEAAQLRRKLASRSVQFPSLSFGWTQIKDAGEEYSGLVYGLSWEAPLFQRNQAEREGTRHEAAIAEAKLRLAERETRSRREAAAAAYSALRDHWTDVSAVVDEVPEVTAAATESFLAGESSLTDLLDTLWSGLESQLAALDLHGETLAAHRRLELSVGRVLTRGEMP